ncbi:alpha/beta fold hydrolase [Phytoactinopolyspora halotolerans]|uniref:Alpha/beta hydrolase n=1 Tax=Phytoactinopolyspora halotolerans TaxID=1981512 RepID=A0A6L9S8P5_9ACTN|nr:alpha/beta hydrolase [Phytoactinopolyspora halotolerans]NEE01805.1 alpha/beta hydrolase [Phytoactinopolyspora halotolerans]
MVRSALPLPVTDYGGTGPVVLALHGHFGSARTFGALAWELRGRARVVAVDLRGHGHAERGGPFTRDAYVGDVAELVADSGVAPAVVFGHSMGGVTAFQLAARRPELVRAVIVEEAPAVVQPLTLDVRDWPRRAPTLTELGVAIQRRGVPDPSYFLQGAIRYPDGWGLGFDYDDMMRSQELLVGDWWADWTSVTAPVLLMHGTRSEVLPTVHAHEMVRRRPETSYVEFDGCGHWIHDDDVRGVAAAVAGFLETVDAPAGRDHRASREAS